MPHATMDNARKRKRTAEDELDTSKNPKRACTVATLFKIIIEDVQTSRRKAKEDCARRVAEFNKANRQYYTAQRPTGKSPVEEQMSKGYVMDSNSDVGEVSGQDQVSMYQSDTTSTSTTISDNALEENPLSSQLLTPWVAYCKTLNSLSHEMVHLQDSWDSVMRITRSVFDVLFALLHLHTSAPGLLRNLRLPMDAFIRFSILLQSNKKGGEQASDLSNQLSTLLFLLPRHHDTSHLSIKPPKAHLDAAQLAERKRLATKSSLKLKLQQTAIHKAISQLLDLQTAPQDPADNHTQDQAWSRIQDPHRPIADLKPIWHPRLLAKLTAAWENAHAWLVTASTFTLTEEYVCRLYKTYIVPAYRCFFALNRFEASAEEVLGTGWRAREVKALHDLLAALPEGSMVGEIALRDVLEKMRFVAGMLSAAKEVV